MADRIRIVCVDDRRVVREGIAAVLGRHDDMDVVAAGATGFEAVRLCRVHRPDVVVMDLQMPGMGGLAATEMIRAEWAGARIVVLTTFSGEEDICRAVEAGAAAYLRKDTMLDDLARVVREVHNGSNRPPADILRIRARRSADDALTRREVGVLELVGQGLSNKDIAAALGIAHETAKVHVKNILRKLGVTNRTAAVRTAMKQGLLRIF